MFTLVIGGSASGKSAYAEQHVLSLPGECPRIYLATMEPAGQEAEERIRRHRALRKGRGFSTMECCRDLEKAVLPPGASVLLEDMGNLAANELFPKQSGGSAGAHQTADAAGGTCPAASDPVEKIVDGVESVRARSSHLTVVTNEVFSGGQEYAGDTDRYLRVLARVNRELAWRADRVVEIHCGLEQVRKEEPFPKGGPSMIFVTGPLYSGKQDYIMRELGWDDADFAAHAARDVQDLAARAVQDLYVQRDPARKTRKHSARGEDPAGDPDGTEQKEEQERADRDWQDSALQDLLEALADRLARKQVVLATEVGGGIVPLDPLERQCREAAGRLACMLAERADVVVRMCCGIPQVLKGNAEAGNICYTE